MRFVGSTLIDVDTSGPHLDEIVQILRDQLELAAERHSSVIEITTRQDAHRVVIRMELEANGTGFLDEIADQVLDAAIAATQAQLSSSSEAMTVLGSSLIPA